MANKPTDLDRPLRSVGRQVSCSVGLDLMVLRDLLDGYGAYTLKWEVDELEKTALLTTKGF